MDRDTIHALSSGRPPAAIAIIRISGPMAGTILGDLAGQLPAPRQAHVRTLRDRGGDVLDHALVLWFPGPRSATGEDLAELHLHGGRAVVEALLAALAAAGSRMAVPGEFTRRALFNGRLDLEGVEGLSDLLAAETEYQRREALRRTQGVLGRKLAGWRDDLLAIAALYEAAIDYDGEIEAEDTGITVRLSGLANDIEAALSRVSAERLRDGLRVAIVGPTNAGKSSLFNALIGSDAAIVSPIAGTTRDTIERAISLKGMPLLLIDTAGIRDSSDPIERIGIDRARSARGEADIVIDLAGGDDGPNVISVSAKSDIASPRGGSVAVSAQTGDGIGTLAEAVVSMAEALLPAEGDVALNRRYRVILTQVLDALRLAQAVEDMVLAADHVRHARETLNRLVGTAGFEDVLDALFSRFCLGK